ncbi:MAG: hypothetical protein J3R72DRAFT_435449 [Linnemannia gamsii]|nr:MAG: hypothetical protein J3R72DRAFT_435449 [Linnemannia gamsii]
MDNVEQGNNLAPVDLHIRPGDQIESNSSNNQSEPSIAVAPQSTPIADLRPTDHGPFSSTPDELMDRFNSRPPEILEARGGVPAILAGLHANSIKEVSTTNTPLTSGVSSDERDEYHHHHHHQVAAGDATFADCEEIHGRNVPPKRKTILQLIWLALQEKILIIAHASAFNRSIARTHANTPHQHPTLFDMTSTTSSTSSSSSTITSTSTIASINTIPEQQFKYQGNIVSQYVHYDKAWRYHYSCLRDLQDNFSGATQFRVRGVIIIYLKDENNNRNRHSPPRIAHYPDDIIEIFTVTPSPNPSINSGTVFADAFNEPHVNHPQPRPQYQCRPSPQPQQHPIMSPSAEIVAVLNQFGQGHTVLRTTSENHAASNITTEIRPVQFPTTDLLLTSLVQPIEGVENFVPPHPTRTPSPLPDLAPTDSVTHLTRTPSPRTDLAPLVDNVIPPARAPSPRLATIIRSPSPRPPPRRSFSSPSRPSLTAASYTSGHHSSSSSIFSNTSYSSNRPATPPTPMLPPPSHPSAAQLLHSHRLHTPKTPMSPPFSALLTHHASVDPVTLNKKIEDINFRIDTATDRKSEHYGNLVKCLSSLMHQQKAIIEQNHQYQTLQHQQTHHLQHHALSKLDVMDRKLDAILVQNYELHEYTIPRFFVVLPESFEKWDPRSLTMSKYRLYFLCECDAHATDQHGSSSSSPSSPASSASRRRVHLHNHKGYSFSRPDEFMERFGPYVLSMLKILSYCLRAATIAAPATGLINEAVQGTMQGIEAIAKNTLENVINGSISLLKQNLDESGITASSPSSSTEESELDDHIHSFFGLEGADLRRLKTFLQCSDGNETLGSLYRTTTNEGHVKWVCLRHYRQSYRDATMLPFLKMLRENNVEYCPYLRKVSILLNSSTTAKTFFDALTRTSAVDELDAVLDWGFQTTDLELLVKAVFQSSIKTLKLDLKDVVDNPMSKFRIRYLSKNKYQPLLDLLSNKRLQGLSISGAGQFGNRTSKFPIIQRFLSLRSFHFLVRLGAPEQPRLVEILSSCPNLTDLRLGDYIIWSKICPELTALIAAMTQLRSLHLYGIRTESGGSISGILSAFAARGCLRELVCYAGRINERELSEAIRNLSRTLEVLVVEQVQTPFLDLVPVVATPTATGFTNPSAFVPGLPPSPLSPSTSMSTPFSRLTHLDLNAELTQPSLNFLAIALKGLNLFHLGLTSHTKDLLSHVNLNTLRSISLFKFEQSDLTPLFNFIGSFNNTDNQCRLETLSLLFCSFASSCPIAPLLALKRLQLSRLRRAELITFLSALNFSRLEVLMLVQCQYDWTTEEILAVKRANFTQQLMVHLCLSDEYLVEGIQKADSRAREDTEAKLAARRVRFYSLSDVLLMGKPLMGVI